MAKKTEIEQTGESQPSEWVHPEAEAIFNAFLGAYPYAKNVGWKAQFWRSGMLSLRELYPADKHLVNAFLLSEAGIDQEEPKEIPAKQAKQPSEYAKEPDYSAKAGRETSGECESCG